MEVKQIVKTIRLGRKTDEDINRSLLFSFNTKQDVIEINQKLRKLKEATAEIRILRISPDWSLKEREEYPTTSGQSDHDLMELTAHRKISKTMIRYNFAEGDYDQMRNEIKNLSFLLCEDNVEKRSTDLRELLTELTKKIVPLTMLNPECRNNLLFTNTTRQAIRAKNKYSKKFCCKNTKVNFDNYKEKTNAVKTATRNDKRAKKSEIAKDVKMKPKIFWNYVRQ